MIMKRKGLSIKDVRSHGGELSSADILQTRGVLQMRTSALFEAKILDFSKFIVCSHGKGEGDEPVRIFCRQGGGGVNISRICVDVFYGRPLILIIGRSNHVLLENIKYKLSKSSCCFILFIVYFFLIILHISEKVNMVIIIAFDLICLGNEFTT